jgi:hypothetical protein
MSSDDKINEIHSAVLELRGEFRAFSQLCNLKHQTIDEKMLDLNHDVNGNGKPGLKDKHRSLEERIGRIELRLALAFTMVVILVQVYGDKLKKFLGV